MEEAGGLEGVGGQNAGPRGPQLGLTWQAGATLLSLLLGSPRPGPGGPAVRPKAPSPLSSDVLVPLLLWAPRPALPFGLSAPVSRHPYKLLLGEHGSFLLLLGPHLWLLP